MCGGLNIAWWMGGGLKLPDVMILLGLWWVKACGCGRPRCPQDPNFTTSLANIEEIIIMKMMIIAS